MNKLSISFPGLIIYQDFNWTNMYKSQISNFNTNHLLLINHINSGWGFGLSMFFQKDESKMEVEGVNCPCN